jgi:hypothetical protein
MSRLAAAGRSEHAGAQARRKVSLVGDDAQNDISSYKPAHFKNQGGSLSDSYGAGSGMSRKAEFEKLKAGH